MCQWFHKVSRRISLRLAAVRWLAVVAAILIGLVASPANAQSTDKASILVAINRLRLTNGLAPLAFNPALEKAAQRHSDDMAAKGFVDHTGSDGSSATDRISAAGYPAWPSTKAMAEIVYAGSQGFDEALAFFVKDETQLRNIMNPRYREMGIGISSKTSAENTSTAYWALTFGAQPNVLPIFINDGALLINAPQVAIHLTQEEAVPGGEGNAMGSAIEIRISSDSTFAGVNWQKWESLIPFSFDATPGLKTVYVELRDGGGRSTISTASVQYDPNSTPSVILVGPGEQITSALPLDTPEDTPTPFATIAPVQTLRPVATSSQSNRPVGAPTAIVLVVTAQGTAVYNPTPTVLPTPQARPLVDRPDTTLPDWLLPGFISVQVAIAMLGLYWLIKVKRKP
jgi:uncharacterized protein YkwD